jgi:putative oxidoreductase
MEKFLGKFAGLSYAAFRLVAGLLFAQHGAQKLFGWLGGMGPNGGSAPFLSVLFFAGFIEFFGGLLIAAGFETSWAALIASGEMAVAYWWRHAPNALFPIQNRGELAVFYCFAYLLIASHGGGKLSLDAIVRRFKKSEDAT